MAASAFVGELALEAPEIMNQEKPYIILVAYYFPPANAIGGDRPFRFFKYLKKMGYPCSVVTASAQGTGGPTDVIVVPDRIGERWVSENSPAKLSIAAHVERLTRRFVIPACTGVHWATQVAPVCRDLIRRNQKSRRVVVFTTFPPLGALLAGLIIALRGGAAWICDFRDPLYSDGFIARRLEAMTFRIADAVIANTGSMAAKWFNQYRHLRPKLHTICNGFDPEQQPRPREIPARSYRVIVHTGELYGGRTPTIVLESLSRLRQVDAGAREVRVVLQGAIGHAVDMPKRLVDGGIREGWLEVHDWNIPREAAHRLMEEADGLLLLQPQSALQIPGKLFDYLCVGRPILAVLSQASATEEILAKAGVPYVCIYADDEPATVDNKLAEYLRFSNQAVPASEWFRNTFSAATQTVQLGAIVERIS